jgi:hypothetical protein
MIARIQEFDRTDLHLARLHEAPTRPIDRALETLLMRK